MVQGYNSEFTSSRLVGVFLRNLSMPGWPIVPLWPHTPSALGFEHSQIVSHGWWLSHVDEMYKEEAVATLQRFVQVPASTELCYVFYDAADAPLNVREALQPTGQDNSMALSHWYLDTSRKEAAFNREAVSCLLPHPVGDQRVLESDGHMNEVLAAALLHESKQPISTISLAVDNAIARISKSTEAADLEYVKVKLEKIRNSATRMLTMAQSITDASVKNESGAEVLGLEDVVAEAISMFTDGMGAHTRRTSLETRGLEGETLVRAERNLLKHAVLNILNNAQESIEERQREETSQVWGRIVLSLLLVDGLVTLTVTDNGLGVGETQREQIFDLYRTSKVGGSGVGLAFVKEVMTGIGGRVECRRNPSGQGAAFDLHLPVHQPDTLLANMAKRTIGSRMPQASASPYPFPNLRVIAE